MVVESAVSLVLRKLSDVLVQEAVSLYQVRDQVESVERELRRMRCFLKDADEKQSGDDRVKNWVADVRDVAYDAEDIVDTFILRIEQKRRSGFVGSLKSCMISNVELLSRHEISHGIERIKNKIQEISASTERYGIKDVSRVEGSSSRGESLREQRQTSPHLFEETEVVGFEEDIKALVARLIQGDSRRCVVSVVGMGGLGKTTLASKVYNNDAVKKHFDCCAWIFVSEEYVVKDLFQKLIKEFMTLSKEEPETDAVQLRVKLYNHLKEKRYLLVLDDIWKTEAWGSLAAAFPDMNNGSRVLLTTRNREVASYADARSSPLELKQFMSYYAIDRLVDPRERKAIFGTGLVQVCIVHIDSSFPISYFHQHNVGYPVWIIHLLNESSLKEFVDFFSDENISFGTERTSFLSNRSMSWVEV